ncbi:hypothetical protein [Polaromonas sp.]|uniref:hypothetical protein n=1 Tax=Polaromonas sp. TaxID=1869339 RepID=UPI0025E837B7|nr:hypothetical protein [Polaromonas sp.]
MFATFSEDIKPLEDPLVPHGMQWRDRSFKEPEGARERRLPGRNRQRIPGNAKLMMENIRDPYHANLLRTWFVIFGL